MFSCCSSERYSSAVMALLWPPAPSPSSSSSSSLSLLLFASSSSAPALGSASSMSWGLSGAKVLKREKRRRSFWTDMFMRSAGSSPLRMVVGSVSSLGWMHVLRVKLNEKYSTIFVSHDWYFSSRQTRALTASSELLMSSTWMLSASREY